MADKAKHGEGPEHEWKEDCDLIDSLRAQLAAEVKRREQAEKERDDLKNKLESWREKCDVLATQLDAALVDGQELYDALEDLMLRCDGSSGVRADGSNIDTMQAHAAIERSEAARSKGEENGH